MIENIKQERRMKQKQLWVVSRESGVGKTTMLMLLSLMLRIYRPSRNEWDDDYVDGAYDLAVIDEYRGWKPIDWINMFAEGSLMPLKRRGISDIVKRDKIPMIICSNWTIYEAYRTLSSTDVELICARFEEVDVSDDLIRIEWDTVSVSDL